MLVTGSVVVSVVSALCCVYFKGMHDLSPVGFEQLNTSCHATCLHFSHVICEIALLLLLVICL
jgi:hypothetical protein